MTGDKLVPAKNVPSDSGSHEGLGEWLSHNVLDPFVNGTGVIQIYNTFADKPADLLPVDQAKTGHLNWIAQTMSQTAGAIVPFVAAGKLAGAGMDMAAERVGVDSLAGKILTNGSFAQIVGAGAYSALEKPADGDTRIGNAASTMFSFAMFEGGNKLINKNSAAISNGIVRAGAIGLGRLGVGAAGGLTSYETANYLSSVINDKPDQATVNGAWQSVASGGFLNFALPAVQASAGKVIDYVKGSNSAPPTAKSPDSASPDADRSGSRPAGAMHAQRLDAAPAPEALQERTTTGLDSKVDGQPALGAVVGDNGINFSIASQNASQMNLLLFDKATDAQPSKVVPMTKNGNVWSTSVDGLKEGQLYLYSADGSYTPTADGNRFNAEKGLLDPYAKAVTGSPPADASVLGYTQGQVDGVRQDLVPSKINDFANMPKAVAVKDDFPWNETRPHTPMSDSVIYELNVRGFTGGDDSLGKLAGTYAGLKAKIPYLKDLGITAVELMPVQKFFVNDSDRVNPVTGEKLQNAWGYNTLGFFAPEESLAADGTHGQQVAEFKGLVEAMHNAGLEVILDVVYNHSGEGNQDGPTVSFKGLDNPSYYMLDSNHPENYVDHTGTGNTMNVNEPETMQMVLDSLRYWANQMHVDGFRFDLAPIFKYLPDGSQMDKTPIIQAIENDPVLSKLKMIAEPWSIDQYYMGRFSDRMWGEWNDETRDQFRKFVKSDVGEVGNRDGGQQSLISAVADRMAGSTKLFDQSQGHNSVNFVTAHDGFTLNDLVSYDQKHNLPNGENNRDGNDSNNSWNSGYEGDLKDAPLSAEQKAAIEQLRTKQMKNLKTLLMVSRGTPMMLYGDEVRRTQGGDNNAYNQVKLNQFDWNSLDANSDMHRFDKMLIDLRKSHNLGRNVESGFQWHGAQPNQPDFSDGSRLLAVTMTPPDAKPVYIAFNSYWQPLDVQLPPGNWKPLLNTDAPTGQDIVLPESSVAVQFPKVTLAPRSSVIYELQPDSSN